MTAPLTSQIMLYMSAQNELSAKANENIAEIQRCTALELMCTYIMLDKLKSSYEIANSFVYKVPPTADSKQFEKSRIELPFDKDVTNPRIFDRHLRSAHEFFSTFKQDEVRQRILFIWGHGNGIVMLDEEKKGGVKRSQAKVVDFANVLSKRAEGTLPINFDIVAFDSCYMALLETMYELRTATQFVLCSSTIVDSAGFPYQDIFQELKVKSHTWDPETAAKALASIYDKKYLKKYPDGSRFLFVCAMDKIAAPMEKLNELGAFLSSLIETDAPDDPVRTAVSEALVGAGANSQYTYSLRFLKMLQLTMEGRIPDADLQTLKAVIAELREAIKAAFSGNMGDTPSKPISPNIWAPLTEGTFMSMEPHYKALEASADGNAGWVSFWRKYHRQGGRAARARRPMLSDEKIGMATAK